MIILLLLLTRVADDSRFGGIIGLLGGIGGGILLLFTGFAFDGKLLFFKLIDEFEICVFMLAAIATTLFPGGILDASTFVVAAAFAAEGDGAGDGADVCSVDGV